MFSPSVSTARPCAYTPLGAWDYLSLREMIVFAKRTSFVARYREFWRQTVERCVTDCVLEEELVASEVKNLATTFVTRRFPPENSSETRRARPPCAWKLIVRFDYCCLTQTVCWF